MDDVDASAVLASFITLFAMNQRSIAKHLENFFWLQAPLPQKAWLDRDRERHAVEAVLHHDSIECFCVTVQLR